MTAQERAADLVRTLAALEARDHAQYIHDFINAHGAEAVAFGVLALITHAENAAREQGRAQVLEEAAEACLVEQVDAADTGHEADEAYNLAVHHCAAAIRALKTEKGRATE